MANFGKSWQSGRPLQRNALTTPIQNSRKLVSLSGSRTINPSSLCGLMTALTFLLFVAEPAYADCNSLRKAVIILAGDLANQADSVTTSETTVNRLASAIEDTGGTPSSELRTQKNAADRNLEIAREQFDEIVGKIAERGRRIREECASDG